MKVAHSGRGQFVDAAGVLQPVEVEILPEGGGAAVDHRAPVRADQLNSFLDFVQLGHGVEHEGSAEGADVFPGGGEEGFAPVGDSAEDLEGGGGFVSRAFGAMV